MKFVMETVELSKKFGELTAVDGISTTLEEGHIVGLIGPNGAGKSTFLNSMAGLFPPTSGKVFFEGKECTGFTPQRMCHLGLARTFQIPQPFPKMTALETVLVATLFGRHGHARENPVEYAKSLLDFVEFPLPPKTACENLNTVQLKRLDLARALGSNPKMLFLDELAAGLTESEILDMIVLTRKIRDRGITILMVEHIMKLIITVCEYLIVIQFGRKISEGRTEKVAQDPVVLEAYLGTAKKKEPEGPAPAGPEAPGSAPAASNAAEPKPAGLGGGDGHVS
ncbi:MAG: ABC transporter ATP-binding protein [Deltaproteobacteria bacterium]|nr:ABC transporter ATP-binding protein [Deltaproteobacteria bacterium]